MKPKGVREAEGRKGDGSPGARTRSKALTQSGPAEG